MRDGARRLLADVEAHVGDLYEWPRREQALILAGVPPGRLNIFRFVLFLLGNGCPPRPLARLLVGAGLVPTDKARRDAWDVLRDFRTGTLRRDAFYWCMRARARVEVHGLTSWCRDGVPRGMKDVVYWYDAQRLLCPSV